MTSRDTTVGPTREHQRLADAPPWRAWGPYLSERQWGTVREDYSADGSAWEYFTHDHARSRAYRWGEDGLAGFCDEKQRLCLALALWNGVDPILKERLFGLTNSEGNHGEDVKEYYFYLDATPTHSWQRFLYKYPQAEFPYAKLVAENRARGRAELEYELLDTGVFDDDRYFDVTVDYAKDDPQDILIRITVENRGAQAATLHVLPTLWFRNTWSWSGGAKRPELAQVPAGRGTVAVEAAHPRLGRRWLHCEGSPELHFTENESNAQRLWGQPNRTPFVKDGIHERVIHGCVEAVNPERKGTKAAAHWTLLLPPRGREVLRLRLNGTPPGARAKSGSAQPFGRAFEALMKRREREADEFYESITPPKTSPDQRLVMRQGFAGMLWTKQYYHFDLDQWLSEHSAHPLTAGAHSDVRNRAWVHMVNDDVISMPDKWEYPWYAAWDLAFHAIALSPIDLELAKSQLELMLREMYLHPSGQIPAYEWNFGDVNPPVHAWATRFIYGMEKDATGKGDIAFLTSAFRKLLLNFTWWVNRKDPAGRNVFEGGFLGLDNIGVFDRSAPLPTGGALEQADGTAWMVLYSANMLELALELIAVDPSYEDMALKFVEHFLWISSAMDKVGAVHDKLWDEEDGFFYDVLRLPDGRAGRLKVRSMVGLLPLCAAAVIDPRTSGRHPRLYQRVERFLGAHPELAVNISDIRKTGVAGRFLLGPLDERKLRRALAHMLDEQEFLSPYGVRALSRYHLEHPYKLQVDGREYEVRYEPAESSSGLFGGNSNWRGPVWFPVNLLVLRALIVYYAYYGDAFRIECPTGSGNHMTLFEVFQELAQRLMRIFLRDEHGRRPVFGGAQKFQTDPHWRDRILFYEYFHGDNGAGLGASHQTGWTGLVAKLIQMAGSVRSSDVLGDLSNVRAFKPRPVRRPARGSARSRSSRR